PQLVATYLAPHAGAHLLPQVVAVAESDGGELGFVFHWPRGEYSSDVTYHRLSMERLVRAAAH
ncbi:MAG: hypothetical protein AAGA56_31200, partial [Myxococcota bacterium]